MGTAGSVRLLMQEIKETIVVGSGDSVASFDIMDLIETHGSIKPLSLWPFGKLKTQPSMELLDYQILMGGLMEI